MSPGEDINQLKFQQPTILEYKVGSRASIPAQDQIPNCSLVAKGPEVGGFLRTDKGPQN